MKHATEFYTKHGVNQEDMIKERNLKLNKLDDLKKETDSKVELLRQKIDKYVLNKKCGKLVLVDLAGSEYQNEMKTDPKRLKEAKEIGKSLLSLKECIRKINLKKSHVN